MHLEFVLEIDGAQSTNVLIIGQSLRDILVSHTNRISPKDISGKAKKIKVRWDQIHMGYDWKKIVQILLDTCENIEIK